MQAQALIYGRRAAELRIAASLLGDTLGKKALLTAAERYEKLAGQNPARIGALAASPKPKALPLRPPAAAYRLEMWNQSGKRVEKTLAESVDSRVAYAAYFAAAREFPMRYLTLTQDERVLARWQPPGAGRR